MRITRERLLTLALQETERRAERGEVLSGYVIGSLAAGDPLLGGSADIDLVLIHASEPSVRREIVPLSSEIHLDIAHRPRAFYRKPRTLRKHPWYGPEICEPGFLYDPTHFFEWVQAAVRGQFYRPDFVHARGQAFLRRARQYADQAQAERSGLRSYLRAVLETVNAIASLTGVPAAGRQVGVQLASKLGQIGQPELFGRFQQLLGADRLPQRALPEWVAAWARAYDHSLQQRSSPPDSGVRTDGSRSGSDSVRSPERRNYYLAGFQSMVEDGRGSLILWPLLANWECLALHGGEHAAEWQSILEQLQLSRRFTARRLSELESLQDEVDAQLERWSEKVGA